MGVPLAAFLALYCKLEITGLWVGMVVMFMMQVREVSQESREVYLSCFSFTSTCLTLTGLPSDFRT